MHKAGALVQGQPPAHHVDGCQFSFSVAGRHIDNQSGYLAAYYPVQCPLYDFMVWRDDHFAAGALFEEIAGKVQSLFLTFDTAR